MFRKLIVFLLICALLPMSAWAWEREEMRSAWQAVQSLSDGASPYQENPDPVRFFPGSTTQAAQDAALACLNFLRELAGLDPVKLNSLYTLRAQSGAVLLAANDRLEHDAPRPEGMNADLYASAHMGTSQGNIAKFNWMHPDILIDGVRYFARDDGSENLAMLGHRRWLLNPYMAETGFGLANSQSGMSYVSMYAVDMGNTGAQWEYVAWPATGIFPVEMMRNELPWSVSLNDAAYDLSASRIEVLLKETVSGSQYHFDLHDGSSDGFCALSFQPYGSGSCIIFRPDFDGEYVQNQVWTVEISGLKRPDGSPAEISYICEMVSLYPQDVANVELSQIEAQLSPGEPLYLTADIIPAYADDLSLSWESSDSNVATVSATGTVLAVGPGECSITATSANGRSDSCIVQVTDSQ